MLILMRPFSAWLRLVGVGQSWKPVLLQVPAVTCGNGEAGFSLKKGFSVLQIIFLSCLLFFLK